MQAPKAGEQGMQRAVPPRRGGFRHGAVARRRVVRGADLEGAGRDRIQADPGGLAQRQPLPAAQVVAGCQPAPVRCLGRTFAQPGAYMLRVRADNFGRPDTSAGNQCCWTNGYIQVTVK